MATANSYGHEFSVSSIGLGPTAEIFVEAGSTSGPKPSDTIYVFSTEQARALGTALLECVRKAQDAAT